MPIRPDIARSRLISNGRRRTPRSPSAVPSEHDEQAHLFRRLASELPHVRDYAVGSANGLWTTKAQAGKAKASGLATGYPDVAIDLPRGRYHGARIEMKRVLRRLSRVSDEQRDWIARLREAGYYAVVCYGCDAAMDTIRAYMALGPYHPDAQELPYVD